MRYWPAACYLFGTNIQPECCRDDDSLIDGQIQVVEGYLRVYLSGDVVTIPVGALILSWVAGAWTPRLRSAMRVE